MIITTGVTMLQIMTDIGPGIINSFIPLTIVVSPRLVASIGGTIFRPVRVPAVAIIASDRLVTSVGATVFGTVRVPAVGSVVGPVIKSFKTVEYHDFIPKLVSISSVGIMVDIED